MVVANREAHRIFDLDDGIRLARDQHLTCRDPDLTQALKRATEAAASNTGGEDNRAETLLAIPRLSRDHPFLIEVAPLRDCVGEVDVTLEGALITIIDPSNSKPFSTEKVAKAYDLTHAETAVCAYLVDGWTNNRIADERGVTIDTTKAQVASILQKTGTKRRSKLIRLVLKSSPPIDGLR